MNGRCIGIRREEKSDQERRAPLTPDDVRELSESLGITFVVQPSPNRIFPDAEYAAAGAEISKNLGDCDLIVSIKEVLLPSLIPNKPYLLQPYCQGPELQHADARPHPDRKDHPDGLRAHHG